MLLRIAMMRNELQRQRKALSREIDLRQKERTQLQRKGTSPIRTLFYLLKVVHEISLHFLHVESFSKKALVHL